MSWKTVGTNGAVHVIPLHDDHPHIPQRCCECTPVIEYADPVNGKKYPKPVIKHRDALDRALEETKDSPHGQEEST